MARMTKRAQLRLAANQRSRAEDLREFLNTPRFLQHGNEGTIFLTAEAADVIVNWLQQEHRFGRDAQRRTR